MKCFMSMSGITRINRIINEEIWRKVGLQNKESGHVERMAKRVYDSGVQGETIEIIDGWC